MCSTAGEARDAQGCVGQAPDADLVGAGLARRGGAA